MAQKRPRPDPLPTGSPALAAPSLLTHPTFQKWAPSLSIILLSFLFLWPSLTGAYIWDDDQWLTHNPIVQRTETFPLIWTTPKASPHYYPLVFTTYWLEYKLWGLGPIGPDGVQRGIGYHVDNLLLHIGSALLIFLILKKLKLPGGTLGAWLAAAVFAIHPVNVESVAWVAERKNCLCGVFFFASLYYGLKFFRVIDPPQDNSSTHPFNWKQYAAALLLFLAALLSKTIAAPLAPALLLLIWWRRGTIRLREIALSLPFFAIAIALGINSVLIEHGSVGTNGPEFAFSFLQKTLIASNAVWFYLAKLFWPYPVVQLYPRFPIVAGQPITAAYLYLAPVALLLTIALLYFFRKKISRGPLAAFLFFIGVLGPALGFITFYTMYYTFVADHYQYLACIAIIVLAVEMLLWAIRRAAVFLRANPPLSLEQTRVRFVRLTSSLLSGGILLSLGVLAYGASSLYQDPLQLWTFNIEHSPACFAAYAMRGIDYLAAGPAYRNAGLADLKHSIELKPDNWANYQILGLAYFQWGMTDQAAFYFNKSIALIPDFVKAGRANVYEKQLQESVEAALKKMPATTIHYPHGQDFDAGKIADSKRDYSSAIKSYLADLQKFPRNPETLYLLGNCYLATNDFTDAAAAYRKAITLNDQFAEAWYNLGLALSQLHQEKEAVEAVEKAQEINPAVVLPLLKEGNNEFRKQ